MGQSLPLTGPARRMHIKHLDPQCAKQPRRALQDCQPRIRHRQKAIDRALEVRPEPDVLTQRGHRALVTAKNHGVKLAAVLAEHRDGALRRGLQSLPCLLLPPSGEPVLGCAARSTTTVH